MGGVARCVVHMVSGEGLKTEPRCDGPCLPPPPARAITAAPHPPPPPTTPRAPRSGGRGSGGGGGGTGGGLWRFCFYYARAGG